MTMRRGSVRTAFHRSECDRYGSEMKVKGSRTTLARAGRGVSLAVACVRVSALVGN